MLSGRSRARPCPVATLTPDLEPGYGVKVENTSGALPVSAGSSREDLHLRLDARAGADDDVVGQSVSIDVGAGDGHPAA